MSIFALSDLHLCFSRPEKTMEIFGPPWEHYQEKIKTHWEKAIKKEDLVLIPGDISWATKMAEAIIDLNWINQLPGQKLIIKGNHDYWWPSNAKLKEALPPSINFLQNNAFQFGNASIAGTRMWDSPDFNFDVYVDSKTEFRAEKDQIKSQKIYEREIGRLKTSLAALNPKAKIKIAMTHFPPVPADLSEGEIIELFQKTGIQICVFGHLHNLKKSTQNKIFGRKNQIQYKLCSADFLNFQPLKIVENAFTA